MYMQGKRIYRLSDMNPGYIYMYVCDTESSFGLQYAKETPEIIDEDNNVLFTFILLDKVKTKIDTVYHCNLLEVESAEEITKLYDSIEQHELDEGRSALYLLGEV